MSFYLNTRGTYLEDRRSSLLASLHAANENRPRSGPYLFRNVPQYDGSSVEPFLELYPDSPTSSESGSPELVLERLSGGVHVSSVPGLYDILHQNKLPDNYRRAA